MATLDRSRPLGIIRGEHPASYIQDGKYFLGNGTEYKASAPKQDPVPVVPPAIEGSETLDDLESMHWSQLRKLVEDAGGTWSNKTDAMAFLKAKG